MVKTDCPPKDPLLQVLERHGIHDAEAFLLENGSKDGIVTGGGPISGAGRYISRAEVDAGLSRLRHL